MEFKNKTSVKKYQRQKSASKSKTKIYTKKFLFNTKFVLRFEFLQMLFVQKVFNFDQIVVAIFNQR